MDNVKSGGEKPRPYARELQGRSPENKIKAQECRSDEIKCLGELEKKATAVRAGRRCSDSARSSRAKDIL
jgi:hypothetical protein